MYYDNVLRHRSAATQSINGLDMACAVASDRRRQIESEKHGELPIPGQRLGAVAEKSDMHPGLAETGEALFALRECSPSVTSDFSGVYMYKPQFRPVSGARPRVSRRTMSPPPSLFNCNSVLGSVDCRDDSFCHVGQSSMAVAVQSVLHPGLDGSSEALLALTATGQSEGVISTGQSAYSMPWSGRQ